jgi:hypothetical protein
MPSSSKGFGRSVGFAASVLGTLLLVAALFCKQFNSQLRDTYLAQHTYIKQKTSTRMNDLFNTAP